MLCLLNINKTMNTTTEEESERIASVRIFILDKNTKSILLFYNNISGFTGFCFDISTNTQDIDHNKEQILRKIKSETGFCVNNENLTSVNTTQEKSENNYKSIFTILITEFDYPQNGIPSNSKWWHNNQLRLGQINFISKDEEHFVLQQLVNAKK